MPRVPRVPSELTSGPFTVGQALGAGLSRRQLEGRSWRRLRKGVYVWVSLARQPLQLLRAVRPGLPAGAAFSGRTAAWLHGLDFEPYPIEVTVPKCGGVSHRAGVALRRSPLPLSDVIERRRLPVTSPLRTTFDLARRRPLVEAVVAVDMALQARLVDVRGLRAYIAAHPTFHGVAVARTVLALAEPRSESPMETRLRLLLVLAGLPRPQAQAELCDERGGILARADLYYPAHRLAIEYDGGTHRDSLVADNRRQNRLLTAGYRLLRFTADDLRNAPEAVVDVVRRYVR